MARTDSAGGYRESLLSQSGFPGRQARLADPVAAEQGRAGKQAVVNANVVRSFLIHNGVLIQGPIWRG